MKIIKQGRSNNSSTRESCWNCQTDVELEISELIWRKLTVYETGASWICPNCSQWNKAINISYSQKEMILGRSGNFWQKLRGV